MASECKMGLVTDMNKRISHHPLNKVVISCFFFVGTYVVCCAIAFAEESVDTIMRRVAENQEKAQAARQNFLYRQELHLRFLRSDGQVAREDFRHFDVFPQPQSTEKKLVLFLGRYFKNGKFIDYHEPGFKYKELDLDGELINELANDFANDQKTRDGLSKDLFPLTGTEQRQYLFRLKGRENYRGNEVYRISFVPVHKPDKNEEDGSSASWAGEVLVDATEFQAVQVSTHFAGQFPLWIKTFLGTNIQHLGFKVEFAKFEDGIWFPVSYGGEFNLKVVHLYKRTMVITLRNLTFRKATTSTTLAFNPEGTDSQ
jgi:hypothetical protein